MHNDYAPCEVSRVHIWRAVTGGGSAADFLRWLAAHWELFLTEHSYPKSLRVCDTEYGLSVFNNWLVARHMTSGAKR